MLQRLLGTLMPRVGISKLEVRRRLGNRQLLVVPSFRDTREGFRLWGMDGALDHGFGNSASREAAQDEMHP